LSKGELSPANPSEMISFIKSSQKFVEIQPRIFWWEVPFYRIIMNAQQKFCLGIRSEDLANIEIIEQKAWQKHLIHLDRLDHFPLDKAEYYLSMKEAHGVNSIRGLAKIIGEDWSAIAKIIKTLNLTESIKDYLRKNKNDPDVVRFFHLRRLLDIVRQGGERQQLIRFREMMEEGY